MYSRARVCVSLPFGRSLPTQKKRALYLALATDPRQWLRAYLVKGTHEHQCLSRKWARLAKPDVIFSRRERSEHLFVLHIFRTRAQRGYLYIYRRRRRRRSVQLLTPSETTTKNRAVKATVFLCVAWIPYAVTVLNPRNSYFRFAPLHNNVLYPRLLSDNDRGLDGLGYPPYTSVVSEYLCIPLWILCTHHFITCWSAILKDRVI